MNSKDLEKKENNDCIKNFFDDNLDNCYHDNKIDDSSFLNCNDALLNDATDSSDYISNIINNTNIINIEDENEIIKKEDIITIENDDIKEIKNVSNKKNILEKHNIADVRTDKNTNNSIKNIKQKKIENKIINKDIVLINNTGNVKKKKTFNFIKSPLDKITFNIKQKIEKNYYPYEMRVLIKMTCFLVFFILSLVFFQSALFTKEEEVLKYDDSGLMSYKVYVNDSQYYSDNVVDMGMYYIPNTIKSIKFFYNYLLKLDRNIDLKYNYSISQKLTIYERGNEANLLYYRTDNIKNETNKVLSNSNLLNLNENIVFDFNSYKNELANFRSSMSSAVDGNVNIVFNISYNNNDYGISDSKSLSVKVPLTDGIFTINNSSFEPTNHSIILKPKEIIVDKPLFIVLSVIFGLLSLISLIKFVQFIINCMIKSNKYVNELNKIMKDYDRLIVKSKDFIDLSNYKIIEVTEFNELLDARDNLQKPILFNEIHKNQKCKFIVLNDEFAYVYTLKDVS